ncbi:MAG: radical SAM protein [Oscillospiraceae bacterium]|jgi:MoaA/NifB/PqqE/SkfB family radical SAM enzyme|nr:radical SAM protein [Oscillospiraceae bacterium]
MTKEIYNKILTDKIPVEALAFDYCNKSYPLITEEEAEDYVHTKAEIDTPVIGKNGLPKYVILKGYIDSINNQHYYCNVLTGFSKYNLSVNSDMTVSCNCKLRGCGLLGNLREQTLQEIYDSKTVNSLRQSLANGFLPTASCAYRCSELVSSPKSLANYYKDNYSVPNVMMFENTSFCNMKCKGCYNEYIEKSTVSENDTRLFANECKKHEIKTIYLFKYGESFFDKELAKKIAIIREVLPSVYISVSTNGVLINSEIMYEAAMLFDSITFSLDGVDNESITSFQTNGNFDVVYHNMCEIVKRKNDMLLSKPRIIWKYVLFPENDSEENIKKAFDLAVNSGIDSLSFYPGFNTITNSDRIWSSNIFLEYFKKYKFVYRNSSYSLEFNLRS